MKTIRKTWLIALLALCLTGSITTSAFAEIFQKQLILGPGAGEFVIEDLGVGDTMVLTLINPTNQPLVFETNQNLGNNNSWTVPANSRITVDYTYTKLFDDDVEFTVHETTPGAPTIAQGTLIRSGTAERPVAYPTQPPATGEPVRGYW